MKTKTPVTNQRYTFHTDNNKIFDVEVLKINQSTLRVNLLEQKSRRLVKTTKIKKKNYRLQLVK